MALKFTLPVAAAGLILFIAAGGYFTATRSRLGLLIPKPWSNPLVHVQRLAQPLRQLLPKGRILVLSGKYQTVQAAWLAGGFVEPYSVSLLPNLREPLDSLDAAAKAAAHRILRLRGFRDSTALIQDLERPMAAIVLQEEPAMAATLAPYIGATRAEQVESILRQRYTRIGEGSEDSGTVSVWVPK